jgi:hypothetical protein
MKRFFLSVTLLIFVFSVYAEPLTGFLGVPFGATAKEATAVMSARGYGAPGVGKDTLVWVGSTFAGRNADLILGFFNDQFYFGIARIRTDRNKALLTYKAMAGDIETKYGKPDFDVEEYKSPYKKGDGHEETALYVNAAKIFKQWNFDNSDYIMIDLSYYKPDATNYVAVSYSNYEITNKYSEAKKNSDLSDL